MESLHKGFCFVWGGNSEPETYVFQGGIVWLLWAATEKLGERSHVLRRRDKASWGRSLIVSLKRLPVVPKDREGEARSGRDRVTI